MRSFFAVALLTPALLHAQASIPAKSSQEPILQSKLTQPALLGAAASGTVVNSTSTPTNIRISTGVVAPKLTYTVSIGATRDWPLRVIGADKLVVVSMTVDETGKPTNVHIAQSAGEQVDHDVIAAVSQYRYQPGMLDGTPVAVPVRLAITLQSGAKY